MSAEVPTIPPTEATVLAQERTLSRRGVLGLFGGAVAAVALGACSGEKEYYPDGGFSPDRSRVDRSPSPSPSRSPAGADPSSRATGPSSHGDPGEISPSPSPSHREVIEPAGERLEVEWKSVSNRALANRIRRGGRDIDGDPQVSDTDDRKYVRRAAVFGLPVDHVEDERVHIALASPDADGPDADKVRYVKLPGDKFPAPVSAAADNGEVIDVFPFRVGMEGGPDKVAFVSGRITEDRDGWQVETTLRTHPGTIISNRTYSNAPLV